MLTKESITNFFRTEKTAKSQFDQWDAAAYIQAAALSEYRTHDALTTLLTANFISFAAEYTRGEVISTFEMDVDPVNGLLGMMKSYATGILGMGENFEEKLEKQKKSPTRAQLETNNMVALDQWSVSAPVGQLFIWNSPPGLVSEGYAGLSSHSFIFVYEKVSATKVVLHQYRTWMSLPQHHEFQQFATQNTASNQTTTPTSHEIIHNISIVTPKQHNCNTAQELVSLFEKKAYESQHSWKVKPDEMPQIDETKYANFRDFLLSLYIRKVVPLLLTEVPEVNSVEDPKWKAFVSSKKYSLLIKQLDFAFGILAYQPLLKWVEATDTNASEQNSFWKRILGKKETNQIHTLSRAEIEDGLLTMYQLQVDKLHGVAIQKDQANTYSSLASTLLSTTSKGLSLGQCGLGTFIPTQLSTQLALQMPGTAVPAVPGMVGALGAQEKSSLLSHLNSLHYLPLVLPNGETWYIKAEHFAEYQSFFENNPLELSEQGIPIGPCGWAFRGDARGTDDLVLSSSEYTQLTALQTDLLNDLQNNPEEGFEYFADELLASAQSEEEVTELQNIIHLLKKALKKSVDVSDLLFNQFFDSFMIIAHPLLAHISTKVDLSEFVLSPQETAKKVVTVFKANRNNSQLVVT